LELRRQCDAERLTKEQLQRKYNDLKGQYDTNIDALNHNDKAFLDRQSNVNNTKKKNGSNKQKRDGQIFNDDSSEEKLQRLHELENKLIGGEEINNEERKKKRKKKLNEMREKQEQRKRFTRAIDSNDDDMMMRVFDNVQEEVSLKDIRFEFDDIYFILASFQL
jgi:hypothetical protein